MNFDLKFAILKTYGAGKQYQLAGDAGVSESVLSRIVTGRRDASEDERAAIAKALGLPAAQLFPDAPRGAALAP